MCSANAFAAVTVAITPKDASMPVNSTRQFGASVAGTTDPTVLWSVNNIAGGNSTFGTIDATGKYTSPLVPPSGWVVKVKAVSVADASASDSTDVTVRNQIPWVTSVTPNQLSIGSFSLKVDGSRFVNGAQVLWNGVPLTTVFNSTLQLTATGTANAPGTFSVTVANPGPGAVSTPLTVKVVTTVTVTVTPQNSTLVLGGTRQFSAAVANTANQSVTWKVNGTPGGDPGNGLISPSGLYTAPLALPPSGVATISATAAVDGVTTGNATLSLQDPGAITYGRFLDQSTFGPTPLLVAHVKQVGMNNFITEQFALPESPWPTQAGADRNQAIDAFFNNAFKGQDQLRQRTIHALSEVVVVAINKNTNGDEIIPWLQVLSRNAFGNYRTLLKEITLDASMGHFLDLANSGLQGGAPNENYPREVMQLFSIGLYKLNHDGSLILDANNQPIPTYTQADVQNLARALTGWTYNNATHTSGSGGNGAYYPGPMLAVNSGHNKLPKTILGKNLPGNQNINQDLDDSLDAIYSHPNVAPFIVTRLIHALVTSNPSPQYVSDIADVFDNNGSNVKGDMQAVLRAILMHPEARNDNPGPTFGRLRTPMQSIISVSRALNLNPGAASGFNYLMYYMNEGLLDAPSVFGHYSPLFKIPGSGGLYGPEFQIYSASDAVNRANFLYGMIYQPWPINPALQPYVTIAGDSSALINAVDNALLFGRMSQNTRTAIFNALPAMGDNNQRVMTAIYLAAESGEYLVQR